ncbi:MAG: glycerol-3-phosphate acyltransferase [candidate division WOR-3 bacterium]|nr:glycerol-3-phosphate acyltransferase [candidate division WOR-3 bacterium]
MVVILSLVGGYFFGSIPFAIIISRLRGVDIRKAGTGNPGAANVLREVGKVWGIIVFLLDIAKGIIPMLIADRMLNIPAYHLHHLFWVGLVGVSAVAGHCWSVFLDFKGGRGLATTGGVILYLFPKFFLIGTAAYFITQKSPRNPIVVLPIFILVFGFLIWIYRNSIPWLIPFLLIFLIVGLIANRQAIKELKGGTH